VGWGGGIVSMLCSVYARQTIGCVSSKQEEVVVNDDLLCIMLVYISFCL